MAYDPNDPNKTTPRETYVEPVEKRSSPLPLIIGILLALALAYFVLTRWMGSNDTVVVEEPAVEQPAADAPAADVTTETTTNDTTVVIPDTDTPVEPVETVPATPAVDDTAATTDAAADTADTAADSAEESADEAAEAAAEAEAAAADADAAAETAAETTPAPAN